MGIRQFTAYLEQRYCGVLDEDDGYIRFVNNITGRDVVLKKARMINYNVIMWVCNELGVPVPLRVSARRPGARGVRRVIRRKFRV